MVGLVASTALAIVRCVTKVSSVSCCLVLWQQQSSRPNCCAAAFERTFQTSLVASSLSNVSSFSVGNREKSVLERERERKRGKKRREREKK